MNRKTAKLIFHCGSIRGNLIRSTKKKPMENEPNELEMITNRF